MLDNETMLEQNILQSSGLPFLCKLNKEYLQYNWIKSTKKCM